MSTRCQVKVWINEDNVLSYYHHSGGWPSNMVLNLMGIAHGVKKLTRFNLSKAFHEKPEYRLEDEFIVHWDDNYVYHLCVVSESCYILWNEVPYDSSVIRKFLFDPCACKEGVKLDFTKEFVDPREKKMQEIRRVLFSLLPKENLNEEQEEC